MTDHVDLIARFEGFAPEPYWDYHQWSIGYGSYAGSRDRSNPPNIRVSQSEARSMLRQQLGRYEESVDRYNSRYNWTPNERAALISFAYNIGSIDGLTANGTRSKAEISRKILEYNKAGGQTLDGLVRRRQAEHTLFGGGSPELPPAGAVVGVEGNGGLAGGATGAGATGVANNTSDFAAANNTADLWQIAEANDNFWDNEVDEFENYTYTLEFFTVDELTSSRFIIDDYSLDDVATDAWPPNGTKRVIIAKTGVTTEFNIQDLSVQSLGTGSQSGARMSGTATSLNFNLVQVGNTSLNDSLQNAAILMGYTSIHDATWYIKVNFIGYKNNQPEQLKATKVLPFKISDFADLQTSTDARGTATMLYGTIILQKSFSQDINQIDYPFQFKIKETLRDTLDDFINELNNVIRMQNFQGSGENGEKYINTYTVEVDPDFEEFMGSEMNGPNPNLSGATNSVASRSGDLNISQQSGNVSVGSNVYDIIADIINQSLMMRERLTEQSDTFSSIVNVVPIAVPKPGGLNILTNSRGHDVTYYLGIKRTVLFQNQPDAVLKAQNSAKMVDEIFTQGRCRKRYYYQYTGLNDQILDFQVSLNKQLTKTYVAPTDEFIFANFVNAAGIGDFSISMLNDTAQSAITDARAAQEELTPQLEDASNNLESIRNNLSNEVSSVQNDFVSQVNSSLGISLSRDDIFGDSTSLSDTISLMDSGFGDIGADIASSVLTNNRQARIAELLDTVESRAAEVNDLSGQLAAQQSTIDSAMEQGIGALLSERQQEIARRPDENFSAISQTNPNAINGDVVLIEALDTDFVTNLRTEEFNALIDTMLTSPMVFRRAVLPRLQGEQRSGVFRSSDQNDIEVAKQRYYEGLDVDLSMQKLSITIKGDPFWLNNYIPPVSARSIFGVNATSEDFRNDNSLYGGFNYCMIINNKAAGTDELMNIKIANLMIDVYLVKNITSSFSGGMFTQVLEMVKVNFPENFRELNPTIDSTFIEEEPTGNGTSDVPAGQGQGTGAGEGSDSVGVGDGAYKVVTGSGQGRRYQVFDSEGNLVSEGRGVGPNLPFADEYTQTDEIASGGSNPANQIDFGSGIPGGAFSADEANTLLGSDDSFDPRGSRFNTFGDRTGMAPRSVSTEIPANTLTPIEMEQALVIQKEIRRLTTETPLMDMTDTEYARVRQLETTLNDIVENSTTGTRGAVRDEIVQREKRSELASAQEALAEIEDDLDGFYWTQSGREEDEAQREKLRQEVLVSQTENLPYAMQEVKTIVNTETGEREDVPEYLPMSIDERPIIIPKPDPLPDVYIDNRDGTITVEGPPVQNPTVTDDGFDAIDNTSLSEEQKQEYFEALESNNGIKVQQFIGSLPVEQQTEILQLEKTQELVKLPGSSVDMSNPSYQNLTESEAKQLEAANTVMRNFENQIPSLPRIERTFTFPDGTVDRWSDPDWQQLQPVPYIDADGNVQTFNPIDYFPSDVNDPRYGYSPTVQGRMMQGLADNFPALEVGNYGGKEESSSGKLRTEIAGNGFIVAEDKEQEDSE
jgi:GH24 family phage-related lysozyme (muramidase)